MAKWQKNAAIAVAAASMSVAAPASATIFEYTMTNGDVLTIDTETQSGTWSGNTLNATFTSPEFADFTGGENPTFAFTLATMDGTRIINGVETTNTNTNGNRTHPYMLKSMGNGRINLWSWWGDPVVGGDYVRAIGGFTATEVPAPGILGLFGLALVALGLRRRRKKTAAAAA